MLLNHAWFCMYEEVKELKRGEQDWHLYFQLIQFFLEKMDDFIHASASHEITGFSSCEIYWNLSYTSLLTLNNWKPFNCFLFQSIEGSMITLSRGEWMGLPDLQFKDWLKQKKRWDTYGLIFCKHPEAIWEPGVGWTSWMQLPICNGWFFWEKGHSLHQKSILL